MPPHLKNGNAFKSDARLREIRSLTLDVLDQHQCCSANGLSSSSVVVSLALLDFIERSGREIDMFDILLDRLWVELFIRRLRVIGHL